MIRETPALRQIKSGTCHCFSGFILSPMIMYSIDVVNLYVMSDVVRNGPNCAFLLLNHKPQFFRCGYITGQGFQNTK